MTDLLGRLQTALGEHYRVTRSLGAGGMATVFLAEERHPARLVAIKVLRPDLAHAVGSERFLREVDTVATLAHPHILPIHTAGEADGLLYYVMPYVEGESLRDVLERDTQLDLDKALQIVRNVADALQHAHDHGVIHRDVKPENILLQSGHAVVADFGIARAVRAAAGERLTETGIALGTPTYMSPEQAGGEEVDARSDVYSLGCLVYEMLAGVPPFVGPTARVVLARHAIDPVPPLTSARPGLPAHIPAAVERALAKVPADRWPHVAALARALSDPGRGSGPVSHTATAGAPSIAVLPFTNMSADQESEYFTDGITEDVINALSKVGALKVASRTSAFAFKGASLDSREIGRRLNVATLLEGSVRRAGNRLRVTAQLIDVGSGYHLWSEQYDREMHDVFAIQDEISRAIVNKLEGQLTAGVTPLVRRQTDDLEAYNLYLKGRYHWNRRGAGLQTARDCFVEAIARDPNYPAAHSALADSLALQGWYRYVAPAEAFPLAEAAAQRALELDGTLAEAHTSRAFVLMLWDWAWDEAEESFRRAMALNPGYATAHHWFAELLMVRGRLDEAIAHSKRALQLDPLGLIIHVLLGMSYYFARRFEDAVAECSKTLDMEESFAPAYIWLGLAHLQLHNTADAEAAFRREMELSPGRASPTAYLAATLARANRADEARSILAELTAHARGAFVSTFDFALIHFALGDDDEAFRWLDRACVERASWLPWLGVDPFFDHVRDDPRFRHVLQQLGLGQ